MVTHAPQREAVVFEQGDDLRRLASARRDRVRFGMVPRAAFLAIDGNAEPGSDEFIAAIGALYPIAYRLHFERANLEAARLARGGKLPAQELDDLDQPAQALQRAAFHLIPHAVGRGDRPAVL